MRIINSVNYLNQNNVGLMSQNKNKSYRVALDAMGGDFAPINEVAGAIEAAKNFNGNNLEVIFVGKENKIKSALSQFDDTALNYSIVNADEVITMDDDPTVAIKKKKGSSLYKGLEMHANGYADAFVSAGNTGAMLSTSTILLGRIKGVARPTIGSFFPGDKYPSLVLDVGANVTCKPRFLYEFAVMGSIYTRQILGLENPRVGLLNIGEEKSKGTDVIKQAYQLLSESQLNFVGNVEGRDILQGASDVVVCDGFTGNIVLKFAESVFPFIKTQIKAFAKRKLWNKMMVAMAAPVLKKIFSQFDYQQYGGIPILGVNGVTIVGHGKSSPEAIKNMIFKAVEIIKKEINKKIEIALNPQTISEQTR